MPSTSDLLVEDRIKVLVFSKFKQGKTFGALTFPRPNVIDFDHGVITVLNPEFVKKYGLKQIQYYQPQRNLTSQGVPKDYNALDEACKYFDLWMTPGKRDQFDTWVLDSATTLIDASQDKAIILLGGKFKGAASSTYDEAKQYGLVSPKLQDFGAERSMTEQFVRMLVESGKHVVVLCHEREQTNDQGATTAVLPLLTGKSQEDIPIMFHEVYRLQARPVGTEIKRLLQTAPVGGVRCGSRLGVPDGTPWEFDALNKVITDLRITQRKLLQDAKQAAPVSTPASPAKGA
jgi:hypothetical protein